MAQAAGRGGKGVGRPQKGQRILDVPGLVKTKPRVIEVLKSASQPMFLADIVIACNVGYPPEEHVVFRSVDMVLTRLFDKGFIDYKVFNVQKGIYVGPVRAYWMKKEYR